jgi:predicted MPP superfamily phosphohydrolase
MQRLNSLRKPEVTFMAKNQTKSTWRIVKNTLLIILVLIVLVHAIHALTLDRIIVYSEITFSSPNIPAEMAGYTIAFITDIHAAFDWRLEEIVKELNQRQIDLLLLGGDFTYESEALDKTMVLIAQIATTDGIFGVEGNHDKYQQLFAAMAAHGITPLANSGLYVRDGFYLAGVEDLWNRNPDIAAAIADAGSDSFVLLISHNPDVSMLQDTTGVDLILSGHTHGGQVNFFGLWSIGLDTRVISQYGEKFRGGWAESRDGTSVYVCRGIGEYYPRVFARPEVTIITLVRE